MRTITFHSNVTSTNSQIRITNVRGVLLEEKGNQMLPFRLRLHNQTLRTQMCGVEEDINGRRIHNQLITHTYDFPYI